LSTLKIIANIIIISSTERQSEKEIAEQTERVENDAVATVAGY